MLSYLAAELRNQDEFKPVPIEIASLPDWASEVAPWWNEYTALLARIPMDTPVDTATTDDVIEEIAHLLQQWAKGIGVDHHDSADGPWFQMTRSL